MSALQVGTRAAFALALLTGVGAPGLSPSASAEAVVEPAPEVVAEASEVVADEAAEDTEEDTEELAAEITAEPTSALRPEVHDGHISWRVRAADAELTLRPYGIIVANTVYNSGLPFPTAESPTGAAVGSGLDDELPGQGGFTMSARQSRVGLRAAYTWGESARADTQLEFDLWGLNESNGPGAVSQTTIRLRHANLRIGTDRARFVAGQDWSIVTPRLPTSLGHMAVALHTLSGAIWNRLPQLGVEIDAPVSSDVEVLARVAIVRPQSADGARAILRPDVLDPGARGNLPWLQGRMAVRTPNLELGLAGQIGRERYDVVRGIEMAPGYRNGELRYDEVDVPTWLGSFDLRVTAGPVWLQGQAWIGANVNGLFSRHGVYKDYWDADDVFAAGAMAGTLRDVEAVRGYGGWAELGVELNACFSLVGSFGAESGDEDDVDYGQAYQNFGYFGGVIWRPLTWFDASLEYLNSTTFYRADVGYRDDPNYRVENDPLEGADPPTRERRGHNDNVSLTVRLKF